LKSLLVLVLSLSSSLAFAQIDSQVDLPLPQAGSTRLDALESWFQQGTPLSFAEFKGYYSGRCFSRNDKNKPIAAMIGYFSDNSKHDDAGPGFSEPNNPKIGGLADLNLSFAPNYFDDESKAEAQKNDLISKGLAISERVSHYIETPTLSYTFDWEPNGNPDEKHEFKAYNGYIIDRWSALITQSYGRQGAFKRGDTIFMCYFFKKLAE
jgi:hypothetical protein